MVQRSKPAGPERTLGAKSACTQIHRQSSGQVSQLFLVWPALPSLAGLSGLLWLIAKAPEHLLHLLRLPDGLCLYADAGCIGRQLIARVLSEDCSQKWRRSPRSTVGSFRNNHVFSSNLFPVVLCGSLWQNSEHIKTFHRLPQETTKCKQTEMVGRLQSSGCFHDRVEVVVVVSFSK